MEHIKHPKLHWPRFSDLSGGSISNETFVYTSHAVQYANSSFDLDKLRVQDSGRWKLVAEVTV